jgi:hypothetical protein
MTTISSDVPAALPLGGSPGLAPSLGASNKLRIGKMHGDGKIVRIVDGTNRLQRKLIAAHDVGRRQ